MPPSAADDLISGFDDGGIDPQRHSPPQQGGEGESSCPAVSGRKTKGKKSKKSKGANGIARADEGLNGFGEAAGGFEGTFVQPTPAPAPEEMEIGRLEIGQDDAGVGLDRLEERAHDRHEDVVNLWPADEPAPDIVTAIPDPTPPIQRKPPPPAPPTLSPRPVPARPVYPTSLTPPSRPSIVHSPSSQFSRPTSYRTNNTTTQHRRESNPPLQSSPHQFFVEPVAPPHMPQPHFYGLPDLGLFGKKQEHVGKPPGSEGYCYCFDSFADCGDVASARKARSALLVGSEGGLDIYRVLPTKLEVVGRLEGLRGGVFGAKILPAVEREDSLAHLRPLVAVVLHGIVEEEEGVAVNDGVTRYQTTVEIYSLQTQERVAVLFAALPVALEQPTIGHLSTLPRPTGDLRITADGHFITISSGKSGEVFVFAHLSLMPDVDPHFRCLGKYWTSLQSPVDRPPSRPASASEGATLTDESDKKHGVPLMSLNQRWLAIVSPLNSPISIQGTPLQSPYAPSGPGLATHVAPQQPTITCDIAGLDAEGAWSRLTRQAAQGLVKYSQKGIEIGWQGWNELVHPTAPAAPQHNRSSSKEDQFPPTNAPPTDPRKEAREPAVVSIIDLQMLLESEELRLKLPPPPVATFALQDGCNHLSLSSTGLRLLTVNRKAVVSSIWDLKQAVHGIVDYPVSDNPDTITGPCVKQIQQIPRSSPAVVLESAWSRDDEYLAMLSNHGTVHLHEVNTSGSPRKRKRTNSSNASRPDKAQATVSLAPGMSPPSTHASPSNFFGTLRSGFQTVGSQVSAIRSSQPTIGMPTFATLRETATSAGQAGTRVITRGLSQGYSAARSGAADYYYSDDNKIRHKPLQEFESAEGALKWIHRRSGTVLFVAAGGKVHLHPVSQVERRRGESVVGGLKHDRYSKKDFDLPPIRTASDVVGQARGRDECSRVGPHGFWSLRLSSPPAVPGNSDGEPPEQAYEVETNPPYCPFHAIDRVSIYAFDDPESGSQILISRKPGSQATFLTQGHTAPTPNTATTHHQKRHSTADQWVFGAPLPSSTKINAQEAPTTVHHDGDDFDQGLSDHDSGAHMDSMERSQITVRSAGDGGTEEIRVHTRRLRRRDGMEDVDLDEA